jgi:metal-responsive CopG/Arc/MetJ family transcriptional regulator
MTVTITIKVTENLKERIDQTVAKHGFLNKSDFIRTAIIEYINHNTNQSYSNFHEHLVLTENRSINRMSDKK